MNLAKFFIGGMLIVWGLGEFLGFSVWHLFWPLILIFVGLRILTRDGKMGDWENRVEESGDKINEELIFNGINKKYTSKKFNGGKINCIFGGGEIDLTEVTLAKDKVSLECNSIFGGVKLRVPNDVKVKVEATAIAGGVDDKTRGEGKKTLEIKGTAIFGGMEIVN